MKILNKKVLIIDKMHESITEMLNGAGFSADYRPEIRREEVEEIIGGYEVMFVRSKLTVDEAFLQKATNLKIIGRAGAGIDQIDVEALEKRKIHLINAPEGNRDAVAEHAAGMLLGLLIHLRMADAQVRQSVWDREGNRGTELSEKTVGIIGYGFMGQAFARRLQGFGCRLLAYDKYRKDFGDEIVQESSLEQVFEEADVVSIHIPLNEETRGLINGDYLGHFKKNIFLINTARGELLPLKDLIEKLKIGKVKGAALDVLENEKLHQLSAEEKENFDYLVLSDRVLLSPHVAGWTHESYRKINAVLVEKLKNLLS